MDSSVGSGVILTTPQINQDDSIIHNPEHPEGGGIARESSTGTDIYADSNTSMIEVNLNQTEVESLVQVGTRKSMAIRMQMSISMPTRLHHFQFQNSRGVRKANLLCGTSSSFSWSSSLNTAHQNTELEAIKELSEIVPDTMIFDDFERFPPTTTTVSSSLLLGICSLPETRFGSVIENAMVDSEGYASKEGSDRLSCIFNKTMVSVGAELAKVVPGQVSTEVDARLAYDTHGTMKKVHELLKLYEEVEVPQERLLFKIPATWQGIEASTLMEAEGIQTHVTFVYSFPQAVAAAQAGSSVIQIFCWSCQGLGS